MKIERFARYLFLSFPVIGVAVFSVFFFSLQKNALRVPDEHPARFPVTDAWRLESRRLLGKPAPTFSGTDIFGDTIEFQSYRGKMAAVVIFFGPDDETSFDSVQSFNDLYVTYQRWVKFVGVMHGPIEAAGRLYQRTQTSFPVVPDPQGKAVRAYGAKRAVFTALVDRHGVVIKTFPGYSKGVCQEIAAWCQSFSEGHPEDLRFESAPKLETAGSPFKL